MDEPGQLLTVAQVAARWQVKPRTIHRLVRAGRVRAVRLAHGGPLRFRLEDIEAAELPARVPLLGAQ